MALKDRESTLDGGGSGGGDRRHRTKVEKEASRAHKSTSRSSRPKAIVPETGEPVKRRSRKKEGRDIDSQGSSSMAELIPELGRTERANLPYPTFNKNFSKEAVNIREDVRTPLGKSPYTPDPTDVGSGEKGRAKSMDNVASKQAQPTSTKNCRPPSPPETDLSQERKGTHSGTTKLQGDDDREEIPDSRTFRSMRVKKDKGEQSTLSSKSKTSKVSTIKSPRKVREPTSLNDLKRDEASEVGYTGSDLTATSVASTLLKAQSPKKSPPQHIDTYSSPESADGSSPRTPTQTAQFPPPSVEDLRPNPSPFAHFDVPGTESSAFNSPKPPPPPPPPAVPINIPSVDYLLHNGGLPRPAPKTLLSVTPSFPSYHNPNRGPAPLASEIERIFGPYFSVLDQYETVIQRNGSLAVATGYRSVARRLLDRLENVFNRDLSSEGCVCVMCQNPDHATHEGSRGLGWGEVLEWVSGRRELPGWPAFDFATLGVKTSEDIAGLGISDPDRPGSPVKMDPDIGEEFRDHYLQQSKKTKAAVNKWLESHPENTATPPQEVDDETLSFAILTHLDSYDRPIFNALISGSTLVQPMSRAPTPFRKPRSEFMVKTVGSLQRLYRLPVPPRDPEAAIFLLKNPQIHNLIATLSCINASEWEILISGRFDGFLWSGTETEAGSPSVSRGPTPNGFQPRVPMSPAFRQSMSRANTPFSLMRNQAFSPGISSTSFPSRGPTPSRFPVSNDEETEIAVLAEIEREIYVGMEMLEDAFEGLHRKAEMVRRSMRERGAGLSVSLQSRRTSHPDIITPSTPGLGPGYERPNWGDGSEVDRADSEWDEDDMRSELEPDDSASQIGPFSSSRHKRPKRRNERRTPALVEEDED
ncbi:hypothetical protein BJ878DRAFT_528828 [Calycina marina]|uniref:Uncharacterized protein n=1 Tax=Calycina marina TaxID=1763456 RepID=A0A9P7YUJ6_9HELO|nr:hypothetical protein BJ878DRAFT_528828 [Calycina marina]